MKHYKLKINKIFYKFRKKMIIYLKNLLLSNYLNKMSVLFIKIFGIKNGMKIIVLWVKCIRYLLIYL